MQRNWYWYTRFRAQGCPLSSKRWTEFVEVLTICEENVAQLPIRTAIVLDGVATL